MADDLDNMLTGNPAILARKLAEQRVPPAERQGGWDMWWDAMEKRCDEPVRDQEA